MSDGDEEGSKKKSDPQIRKADLGWGRYGVGPTPGERKAAEQHPTAKIRALDDKSLRDASKKDGPLPPLHEETVTVPTSEFENNPLFKAISHHIDIAVKKLNQTVVDSGTASLRSHEETRKHVARLTKMTTRVWKDFYGSDPPPPPPGDGEKISFSLDEGPEVAPSSPQLVTLSGRPKERVPMDETISSHDLTIQSIQEQVQVLTKLQKENLKLQKEQMGKKDPSDTRRFLKRLGDGFLWLFTERDGQRFALILISGLSGLLTTFGATYAAVTGHLPLATSPQPTIVYVPGPPPGK